MVQRSRAPEARAKNPSKKAGPSLAISKNMAVSEIIAVLPEAVPLLAEYGLHCFNCAYNTLETLDEGCKNHGFEDVDIEDLVIDLNELLRDRPARPETLTITREAALALKDIAEKEGKLAETLHVSVDEAGAFCLEFLPEAGPEDRVFFHREVPDLKVFASATTLTRVGGATIDLRDGRFKLDLPEVLQGCACGSEGECQCMK
jgi:hybrid cluster-associated redox disulfide protein